MVRRLFLLFAGVGFCWQLAMSQQKVRTFLASTSDKPSEQAQDILRPYESRKSVTLAVIYSLILPGMGEWYAESFTTGKYSLLAEGGLWISYAGFRSYGNWLRDDARSFATQHSGANLQSKDEQFEVDLGNFLTTADYNESRLRQRESDLLYTDPSYLWNWDSDANRITFRQLRVRSDEVYQNAKFVIAGLVVNRVISAFLAARAASAYNRNLRAEGDWRLRATPSGGLLGYGVRMELSTEF